MLKLKIWIPNEIPGEGFKLAMGEYDAEINLGGVVGVPISGDRLLVLRSSDAFSFVDFPELKWPDVPWLFREIQRLRTLDEATLRAMPVLNHAFQMQREELDRTWATLLEAVRGLEDDLREANEIDEMRGRLLEQTQRELLEALREVHRLKRDLAAAAVNRDQETGGASAQSPGPAAASTGPGGPTVQSDGDKVPAGAPVGIPDETPEGMGWLGVPLELLEMIRDCGRSPYFFTFVRDESVGPQFRWYFNDTYHTGQLHHFSTLPPVLRETAPAPPPANCYVLGHAEVTACGLHTRNVVTTNQASKTGCPQCLGFIRADRESDLDRERRIYVHRQSDDRVAFHTLLALCERESPAATSTDDSHVTCPQCLELMRGTPRATSANDPFVPLPQAVSVP